MSWMHAALLALVSVLLALSWSREAGAVAVPGDKTTSKASDLIGSQRGKVFMQDADAADFFRRRRRRTAKSQDEINAEQRQVLAANERKREYHEDQTNTFESYAEEEEHDDERTRESTEQWQQFHYDGLQPTPSV
ncbi:unique cartilage matrix-associated protein [Esox lucius]|uniref:Unique cartilage matrix-associated protein n=1 Tax=Esox lucius TaxID=8010 RepID=A0AAY5L805_ESOLU|nr:unique cartilage matrix-associated protein [Esox lucius]